MPMNQEKPQPTTPMPNKGSQTHNDPQRASSGQFASTSVRPSPNVTGAPKGKDDAGHRGKPEDMNQKPDSKKADAERRTQPESGKGPAGHTPGNRK